MKAVTTIRIESEILKKAQELGLNVSKACENALKIYIDALTNGNKQISGMGARLIIWRANGA